MKRQFEKKKTISQVEVNKHLMIQITKLSEMMLKTVAVDTAGELMGHYSVKGTELKNLLQ